MILTVTLNAAIDKRYVLDRLVEGNVNRVRECTYTPGGKGLNVARVIAAVGEPVIATGLIGGHAGAYIEEALQKFGVENRFCHVGGESRSCVNIWDTEGECQTEILEPGVAVTQQDFRKFLSMFSDLASAAEVIVISGSAPTGLDSKVYQPLIETANVHGKKVILDTSGELLKMGIESRPYGIKPNLDELRSLTGRDCSHLEDIVEAACEIHKKGVEMVTVSLGEEGSLTVCSQGIFKASVPKIQAVNTVGCGDSLTAGLAMGIREDLDWETVLRRASAISAASAMTEGTGEVSVKDIKTLLPQITVNRICDRKEV